MRATIIGDTLDVRLEEEGEIKLLDEGKGLVVPIRHVDNSSLYCDLSLKVGGEVFEKQYKGGILLIPEDIPFASLDKVMMLIHFDVLDFLKEPFKYTREFWGSQRSVNRRIEIYPPEY